MSSAEMLSAFAGRAPGTIPISALNQFLYCPRRAYLIHVEGIFVDNHHTILGNLAHEAVDHPGYEERAGWELLRALPLFSDQLGLTGKADLVEIQRDASDRIIAAHPVEYKKGPKRRFGNDEVQLCAQALCLEEMLGFSVTDGAIYHAASARRTEVSFDASLRTRTRDALVALLALVASRAIPRAEMKPQCEGCSLHEICLPEAAGLPQAALFAPRTYA